MNLAKAAGPSKVDIPMAPMIDIVFQLLIFFMLNLRIVAPEGDFSIHLPVADMAPAGNEFPVSPIKVGLRSDRDGILTQLTIGQKNLGNDDLAFERLNEEILHIIGRPGNPAAGELEIELDADYECRYQYTVQAISRCLGRLDPQTHEVSRYVDKIKFAPPHKPKA